MGRGVQQGPLVPVAVLTKAFEVRDGALVHRATRRSDLSGAPAGFLVKDRPVVRIQYGDRTRRVGLLQAAWIVAHGAYPLGAVRPRDGDPWNCAASNLMLVRLVVQTKRLVPADWSPRRPIDPLQTFARFYRNVDCCAGLCRRELQRCQKRGDVAIATQAEHRN
jgi:hypothetical protein